MAMIRMQARRASFKLVYASIAVGDALQAVLHEVVSAVKMNAVSYFRVIGHGDLEALSDRCPDDRAGHRAAIRPDFDILSAGNFECGFDDGQTEFAHICRERRPSGWNVTTPATPAHVTTSDKLPQ